MTRATSTPQVLVLKSEVFQLKWDLAPCQHLCVTRWERLRPPVLPLQGGTHLRRRPQRPHPAVSNTLPCRCAVSCPASLSVCFLNPGTCWATRLTWGSGCPPTPKTSSPFTVKGGKVLTGDAKFFSIGCVDLLRRCRQSTVMLLLCSRTHRHHGLHVADRQRPVWECSGTSVYPNMLVRKILKKHVDV